PVAVHGRRPPVVSAHGARGGARVERSGLDGVVVVPRDLFVGDARRGGRADGLFAPRLSLVVSRARGHEGLMGTGPGETTGTPLPSAVLVTVGDELLLGETVDTNAAWLGRKLAALGVDVRRRLTVGDREDEIREAVGVALGAADLVLVTGGLGPTRD